MTVTKSKPRELPSKWQKEQENKSNNTSKNKNTTPYQDGVRRTRAARAPDTMTTFQHMCRRCQGEMSAIYEGNKGHKTTDLSVTFR